MKKPHKLSLAILIMLLFTVIIGFIMPVVEMSFSDQPNIKSYENGLWWAITTSTGVGYGDYYPTSSMGKLLASFLEVIGITSFGTIIALITISLFRKEQQHYWARTTDRFDRIEEKLDRIHSTQTFEVKEDS